MDTPGRKPDLSQVDPAKRPETARRIGVLDQYLSIRRPDGDDDARAACEYGVSVPTFRRMARIWSRARRPELLSGTGTAGRAPLPPAGGGSRPAIDPDLSGVAPQRRPEFRRRLDAVRRYLDALDADPRAEAAPFARELGLRPRTFETLVRAWLLHGRADALPGARATVSRPQRLNPKVSAEVEREIAAAIAAAGTGAGVAEVRRAVRARTAARGIKAPAGATIARRLRAARSADRADGPPLLAIDHCALDLAVAADGRMQVPVLTAALAMPSGRIVAHALSTAGPTPQRTAEVLAAALQVEGSGYHVPLLMPADHTPGWRSVLGALRDAGVDRRGGTAAPPPSPRVLYGALGGDLAGIRLAPLFTHRPFASAGPPLAGLSAPIDMQDARAAVAEAVSTHNRGRAAARPAIAAPSAERLLRAALEAVADGPVEPPRRRRPKAAD